MSSPASTIITSPSSNAGSILPGFHDLPPVFLLPTHLSLTELYDVEEKLLDAGVPLTHDLEGAKLVLGKIHMPKRAEFELRSRGLLTHPVDHGIKGDEENQTHESPSDMPLAKKARLTAEKGSIIRKHVATTGSETDLEGDQSQSQALSNGKTSSYTIEFPKRSSHGKQEQYPLESEFQEKDMIVVANLDWLTSSIQAGKALRLSPFVVYKALVTSTRQPLVIPKPQATSSGPSTSSNISQPSESNKHQDIIARSILHDERPTKFSKFSKTYIPFGTQKAKRRTFGFTQSQDVVKPPHLVRQSTSEFEESLKLDGRLVPLWVREGKKYACERPTPPHNPNDAFIEELKKIRLTRTLTGDEIGVRAYSTSIAALAAYTIPLQTTSEISTIPGCDVKIAHLFHEWKTHARLQTVEDDENDEELKVLRLFYNIWGVGATTARDFYHRKGWRDLDDIVEFGWDTLTRVQQIGVKYYEQFLEKIPRKEVESIVDIVTSHARKVRDDGVECCIVGGYRRGKLESGDVDVVLSHRNTEKTMDLIVDVVESLETEGWISHTLLLATTGSQRDQQPLPFRHPTNRGVGFDTLDKALLVWQDIHNANEREANTNIHRRVDIIIAPWSFIGCAIAGWSGGTTFQRDLRRYAKHKHNWKFDSSGIRDRATGEVIYLGENAASMIEAERMVFEGLGLPYLDPTDRCTG